MSSPLHPTSPPLLGTWEHPPVSCHHHCRYSEWGCRMSRSCSPLPDRPEETHEVCQSVLSAPQHPSALCGRSWCPFLVSWCWCLYVWFGQSCGIYWELSLRVLHYISLLLHSSDDITHSSLLRILQYTPIIKSEEEPKQLKARTVISQRHQKHVNTRLIVQNLLSCLKFERSQQLKLCGGSTSAPAARVKHSAVFAVTIHCCGD